MIYKKMIFNPHINAMRKKMRHKISELSRTTPFMELLERRLLGNVFYVLI